MPCKPTLLLLFLSACCCLSSADMHTEKAVEPFVDLHANETLLGAPNATLVAELSESRSDQAIQAVAEQPSFGDTWGGTLKTSAGVLGKFAAGQPPSAQDFIGLGLAIVPALAALDIINPFVGIGLSVGLSFLAGVLDATSSKHSITSQDVEYMIFKEINDVVPAMIQSQILSDRMLDVQGQLRDVVSSNEVFYLAPGVDPNSESRLTNAQALEKDMSGLQSTVFHADCWGNNLDADACKEWQGLGSAMPGVMLANLHMQSYIDILDYYRDDQAQISFWSSQAKEKAGEYWPQIVSARDRWVSKRQENLAPALNCAFTGHGLNPPDIQCTTVSGKGIDTMNNNYDFMTAAIPGFLNGYVITGAKYHDGLDPRVAAGCAAYVNSVKSTYAGYITSKVAPEVCHFSNITNAFGHFVGDAPACTEVSPQSITVSVTSGLGPKGDQGGDISIDQLCWWAGQVCDGKFPYFYC